jgi:hypothetical protein
VGNKQASYAVASFVMKSFQTTPIGGKQVQEVETKLWKTIPNLLTYFLFQSTSLCLTELFIRDNDHADSLTARESDPSFLHTLQANSWGIAIRVLDNICGTVDLKSLEGSRSRQHAIAYFCHEDNAYADIVNELVALKDKDFEDVFGGKYKHLEILVQSAITSVLFIRADPKFVGYAGLHDDFDQFAASTFTAAVEELVVKNGHRPSFKDSTPRQQKILHFTSNIMRIANMFVTNKQRKARLMDISSRLAEGTAYPTGGGRSVEAHRRESLFSHITGILPERKSPVRSSVACGSQAVHAPSPIAGRVVVNTARTRTWHLTDNALFSPAARSFAGLSEGCHDFVMQSAATPYSTGSFHTDSASGTPSAALNTSSEDTDGSSNGSGLLGRRRRSLLSYVTGNITVLTSVASFPELFNTSPRISTGSTSADTTEDDISRSSSRALTDGHFAEGCDDSYNMSPDPRQGQMCSSFSDFSLLHEGPRWVETRPRRASSVSSRRSSTQSFGSEDEESSDIKRLAVPSKEQDESNTPDLKGGSVSPAPGAAAEKQSDSAHSSKEWSNLPGCSTEGIADPFNSERVSDSMPSDESAEPMQRLSSSDMGLDDEEIVDELFEK